MKKSLFLFPTLFLFCLVSFPAFGQMERAMASFQSQDFKVRTSGGTNPVSLNYTKTLKVPLTKPEPFIAYSIIWESSNWSDKSMLTIRFKNGNERSPFIKIQPDSHAENEGGRYISQLYFTEKEMEKFSLTFDSETAISNLEVHFFSPGKTPPNSQPATSNQQPATTRNACPCPLPDYLGRDGWCPAGDCPPDATPVPTTVTHLIVHHSAGSNTSTDWAATVRSIWNFHVNVNGWDDIGYNWLVDPDGVLYEGRGNDRLGAHFCAQNTGTMGVCVLGDFTAITPTPDAYATLEELLAWKICDIDAYPLGSGFHASSGLDLPYISGHRDGCSTACPGDSFYPTLPGVREQVQACAEAVSSSGEAVGQELGSVNISPNPAGLSTTLHLDNQWVGPVVVTMHDAVGRQVGKEIFIEKTAGKVQFELNLSSFPAGVFWVKISQGNGEGGMFRVLKN